MNRIAIRQQLHETIENIDDLDLLNLVKEILDHKYNHNQKTNISDHRKGRLKASINSIDSGRFFSEEQADTMVNNWLDK